MLFFVSQKANLPQPANGFSSANNTSSPFLNFNDVADPHDPESLQEFYSAHLNEPDTNERCHLVSEDPKAKTNKCRLCDKKYARPSTLQTHMRTHSGEKPYRCHICLKSFSQDANLTAHLRIHSGEKPFKCSVCDRRRVLYIYRARNIAQCKIPCKSQKRCETSHCRNRCANSVGIFKTRYSRPNVLQKFRLCHLVLLCIKRKLLSISAIFFKLVLILYKLVE